MLIVHCDGPTEIVVGQDLNITLCLLCCPLLVSTMRYSWLHYSSYSRLAAIVRAYMHSGAVSKMSYLKDFSISLSGSLTALVCQHSITPLALPCKLILPDRGKLCVWMDVCVDAKTVCLRH